MKNRVSSTAQDAKNALDLANVINRVVDNGWRNSLPPVAPVEPYLSPLPEYTMDEHGRISRFRLKPLALDYPNISTQPAYVIETEKLMRFQRERDEAQTKLNSVHAKLSMKHKAVERTDENLISKAESILAGEEHEDLQAEHIKLSKVIEVLNEAIGAQQTVIRRVNQDLSHIAGRHYSEQHKELVRDLTKAMVEMHKANEAEKALRNDLVRLGYMGAAVPAMHLRTVEDPTDTGHNLTSYWFVEALNYSRTDTELADGVRKARLAAAVG